MTNKMNEVWKGQILKNIIFIQLLFLSLMNLNELFGPFETCTHLWDDEWDDFFEVF